MKTSRFTEEQIVQILRVAETGEQSISSVCRAYGIAENTFYTWRKKYGGVDVAAIKRLRDLEQENARLKRILAERDLELDAGTRWVKEVLAKKGRARSNDVTRSSRCVHVDCRCVAVARCVTSVAPACTIAHVQGVMRRTSTWLNACVASRARIRVTGTAVHMP